jgi:Zn-dependent protease with chaperone function
MITRITVGAEPDGLHGFADYLDGETAILRRAELSVDESGTMPELIIAPPGLALQRWPLDLIRGVPDQADRTELVLALAGNPVSRLIVRDPELLRLLRARCHNLRRRPPVRGKMRMAAWAVAAVACVALIITVLVPLMANQLASYLPPKGERALGDTTFEQIRRALDTTGLGPVLVCDTPGGTAALDRIKTRLAQQVALPYPVTVHVLDHPMVNAFALPGGRIVLFRGLIEAAKTPDEVAAVFAHELGHVANRDPARIALRSAGSIGVLGLLLGDFAGGAVVLFLAERLIQATYSKDAEAAADAFAHRTLAAAGIPPSALGSMFRRLQTKSGAPSALIAHFAAHPSLGDRIARAEAADADMTGALRPALNDTDWRALRQICR